MRAGAALFLMFAACASVPAQPARPIEDDQAARLPDDPPQEVGEQIVEAQTLTSWGVTEAFMVVEVNVQSADNGRVRHALAVLDAMAASIDRMHNGDRSPEYDLNDEPLEILVDHVNDVLDQRLMTVPCSLIFAVESTAGHFRRLPGFVAPKARPLPPREHRLSWRTIACGMESIRDKVANCYAQYKVPGNGAVDFVVAKDGSVTTAAVTGQFAGTPTGACVAAAARTVTFPSSDGADGPGSFELK